MEAAAKEGRNNSTKFRLKSLEVVSKYQALDLLRQGIVRAVARSWHDEQFKRRFLENPEQALVEDLGYPGDIFQRLNLRLSVRDTLHDHFYDPVRAEGWRGTNNKLRLHLPKCPSANAAEALAAFAEYWNFFGA